MSNATIFVRQILWGLSLVAIMMIARFYFEASPFVVFCSLAFILGYEVEGIKQQLASLIPPIVETTDDEPPIAP